MRRFYLRVREFIVIACYALCRICALFLRPRGWVIVERGYDARDNGYWLYKYIKDEHPETKVCFMITPDSADYPKVSADAVKPGSLRGYWKLARAEKLISTHYAAGLPMRSAKIFRLLGLHRKFCFLQHGITINNLPMLYGDKAPMKLFVCGAEVEYRHVKAEFGHTDGVVRYAGLARFDGLHNFTVKRRILVMPTWRAYIKDEEQFLVSEYYERWQRFLNNDRLIQALEDYDMELVFYPHFMLQPYVKQFSSASRRVVIADFEHYDVQTLLKESAVLVTDYSSVMFDFGYMRKPLVCYQFDEDAFFSDHYRRGYFDYRTMGFGDVFTDENGVVDGVLNICARELAPEEKYLHRMEDFFPLYDRDNCRRIYDLISEV